MKKKITIIFGFLLLLSIIVQFKWLGGFNTSDLKGLNVNIMVSIVTILITILIIDNLVQMHENKRRLNDYLSLLEASHRRLVARLEDLFIHIVTKESTKIDLNELVTNLDKYIDQNFLRKKIKVVQINPKSIFENMESEVSYFEFCTEFKKKIEHELTVYLSRYASVIPPEIMNHILKIDDLLKSNMLVSPTDFGISDIRLDINNVKFDPKDFIDIYQSIGNEILALMSYKK